MSDQAVRPRGGEAPVARLGAPRLIAAIAALSFAGAQVLHEAGHAVVALLYGRGPTWGPSSVVQMGGAEPRDPQGWARLVMSDGDVTWLRMVSLPSSETEWLLFHAGGPLLQLIAIAVGLALARRATGPASALGWLLAFVNSAGMVIYYGLGALRGGLSDERNVAELLGTEPLVVAAIFAIPALAGLILALGWLPTRADRLRVGLLGAVTIVVEGPLIFLANTTVRDQVDAGNPLFDPVLGFSAPVLVAAVLAVLVAIWAGSPAREVADARETAAPAG